MTAQITIAYDQYKPEQFKRVTDFNGRYCEYLYDGDDPENNTTTYEYLKDQENPPSLGKLSKLVVSVTNGTTCLMRRNPKKLKHL